MVAIFVSLAPASALADGYVVSPSYAGTPTLSVSDANQVCLSLPGGVAAQMSFCAPALGGPSGMISTNLAYTIPNHDIMGSVLSPTSLVVTWTTPVPTTTELWYSDDANNVLSPVFHQNIVQGYTTSHSIVLTGTDLRGRHLIRVGGTRQGSSVADVASTWQLM